MRKTLYEIQSELEGLGYVKRRPIPTQNEIKKELMLLKLRADIRRKTGRSPSGRKMPLSELVRKGIASQKRVNEALGAKRVKMMREQAMSGRLRGVIRSA